MNALNTILYGPPGTGKTYNTINKAVQIVDEEFYNKNQNNRREITRRFNELLIKDFEKFEGQIAFCTFHQSMSYEDFIEGIKPVLISEKENILQYEIRDGIFKFIARLASNATEQKEVNVEKHFSLTENEFNKAVFYKMSLGNSQLEEDEDIYDYCIENNCVALGWGGTNDLSNLSQSEFFKTLQENGQSDFSAQQANMFIHHVKTGSYVIVSNGNYRFRAIGKVIGEYQYKADTPIEYHHFKNVNWLLKDIDLPVSEIYNRNFQQQTLYKLKLQEIKKDFFVLPSVNPPIIQQSSVKVSYDVLYRLFLEDLREKLSSHNPYLIDSRKVKIKVLRIEEEKIITIGENAKKEDPIFMERLKLIYDRYNSPNDIQLVHDELRQISGTIGWTTNYYAVFKALKDFEASLGNQVKVETKSDKQTIPKYVLIIDEINRGNISQIFGELITLIEEDKRSGRHATEALTVTLPYSKKSFTVPGNLYIIGTMNTADRSVEALDTALRRRFVFEEMMPKPDLLETVEGIDLSLLLETINNRLAALLTKDHTIGHAWLMGVHNLTDLQNAFKNKILPLLQEYFYNNYAKIGLVLGNAFIEQQSAKGIFAKNFISADDLKGDYEEKIIYSLKDPFDLKIDHFQSIYA